MGIRGSQETHTQTSRKSKKMTPESLRPSDKWTKTIKNAKAM